MIRKLIKKKKKSRWQKEAPRLQQLPLLDHEVQCMHAWQTCRGLCESFQGLRICPIIGIIAVAVAAVVAAVVLAVVVVVVVVVVGVRSGSGSGSEVMR